MTATFDFDRLLESVLETGGPQSLPPTVVEAALTEARGSRQRRPLVRPLDRRAWPAPRLSTANPGTARLALIGLVMLLTLALVAAAVVVGGRALRGEARPPGWAVTGTMIDARTNPTATLLDDGLVLVAGNTGNPALAAAELYDPRTRTWVATGVMRNARSFPTATLLVGGKVLMAGGALDGQGLATAELYDPGTGRWTDTGRMTEPRSQHAAVRLQSGKVLVVGGSAGDPTRPVGRAVRPGQRDLERHRVDGGLARLAHAHAAVRRPGARGRRLRDRSRCRVGRRRAVRPRRPGRGPRPGR